MESRAWTLMGKSKTNRTEALRNEASRYVAAKQAESAIEQYNFDRLVRQGVIVEEKALNRETDEIIKANGYGRVVIDGIVYPKRDSFVSRGGVGESTPLGGLKVLPNP